MIFDLLHARQEGQGLNSLSFTFPQVSSMLRSWKMASDLLQRRQAHTLGHGFRHRSSRSSVLCCGSRPVGETPKRSVPGSKTGAKPGTTGYTVARSWVCQVRNSAARCHRLRLQHLHFLLGDLPYDSPSTLKYLRQ